ncbi:50S ribosomal protein L32 [Candidatus Peregrinibacteria bacterium CG1_02_41_10]|nr:MAG: 50S ribosomal protein L32 [Candidatus Peregrinibacteria bacterium CG1_02_41_10]
MAVPKKKVTRSERDKCFGAYQTKKRAKISGLVKLVECPQCKNKKLAHHICPTCGTYQGRQILKVGHKEAPKKIIKKIKA